ncbi:hypothetical protein LJC59_03975 [Desulfovibrio sp. OttesenSCG-928-A18]|nr:hypothetical protein [Desulfovibrio sp. OttesenSCG-928-A18]
MDQKTPSSPENTQKPADKAPGRPAPKKGSVWLFAGGLVALVLVLGWLFLSGGEDKTQPAIDPGSPAAKLLRDDADKQARAEAELKAAKAGAVKAKEAKLFLQIDRPGTRLDADNFIISTRLSMDSYRCSEYAGNMDQCRELWKGLDVGEDLLDFDPPLPGKLRTSISDNAVYVQYLIPAKDLPKGGKAVMQFKGLPNWDKALTTKYDITLPTWQVDARFSSVFEDPQSPEQLIMQVIFSSNLPLDVGSVEKGLRFSMEGDGGGIGSPVFSANSDRELVATIPVTRLPVKPGALVLWADKDISRANGRQRLERGKEWKAEIPARDEFVLVTNAQLLAVPDEDNRVQPTLLVLFSHPVQAEEAQKAVRVKLLPRYKNDEDKAAGRKTDWAEVMEDAWIQDDEGESMAAFQKVVDSAPEIELSPVPLGKMDYSSQFTFRYKAPVGRHVMVEVPEGLKTRSGYTLDEDYQLLLFTPEPQPELRLMQQGSILGLAGARKLALASRGIPNIKWEAWRIRPDYINLLAYRSSDFTDPDINGYSIEYSDISDRLEGSIPVSTGDGLDLAYSSLDLNELIEKGARGIFQIRFKGESLNGEYHELERFILLTDIAMVVKQDTDDNRDIFLSSFARGVPLPGAELRVIARNGFVLMTRNCDENGKTSLPDLSGFSNEKEAVALEARYGNDMTYMLLDSSKNYNTGIYATGNGWKGYKRDAGSIRVFVFSERGIYRPGEPFHFGIIAKSPDWDPAEVDRLPLRVRLFDPLDQVVADKNITLNPEGITEITLPSSESSPTGRYYLQVRLWEDTVASHAVQLEEFQPDRIKASSAITGKEAKSGGKPLRWLLPEELKAEVRVENLYGTPLSGGTVKAGYEALRATQNVISYQDYAFSSPAGIDSSGRVEQSLGERSTDDEGKAVWSLPLDNLEAATYRVHFQAEAFEEGGGRSVFTSASCTVSPYSRFIGWRSNAPLNFLAKDAEAAVEFIAVGRSGAPEASGPMKLDITATDYKTLLTRDESGAYRYEAQSETRPVHSSELSIPAEGLTFKLPTEATGEFTLSLTDEKGVEFSRIPFTVAGGADRHQGLKRDATLRIRLDKLEYKAGEEIQVFISAPYAGAGLITLESDRVLAHTWFKADTTDSVQRIAVPEDFQGRGFLMVHMLRDINSEEIFMDPSAVAITPFIANIDQRDMGISLESPKVAVPGEDMTIRVSAKRPGKAVIFAVDEGVLQLTSYKTPSPISYFLKEKLHYVRGMQNWNLLMPEYGLVQRDSAFGGDYSKEALDRLNPFKRKSERSVVYWSGLVDIGPEGRDLTWPVPSYFNGRLRVMAVAAGLEALGESERMSLVRAPVIITPTLPLAVAPGDVFELNVVLANNCEGSGKAAPIRFSAVLDQGLSFESAPPELVKVDEGGSSVVSMRLKASDRLGESTVSLTATVELPAAAGADPAAGGEQKAGTDRLAPQSQTARRPVSLSVRPASPRMSAFSAGRLTRAEQVIPVARELYAEYSRVEASLSGLPLPLVAGLSGFLTEFPHGCTEQVLSAAFPYALLERYKELLPNPADGQAARVDAEAAINKAVRVLRSRQIKPGRYALWPQQNGSYDFLTVYSLDFLISAKEAGFNVPENLMADAAKESRAMLLQMPLNLNQARLSAYAAWVYTRAGAMGIGERYRDISRLVKHCDEHFAGWRRDVSAALLAGAYSLMLQNKEAEALIKDVQLADPKAKNPWRGDNWFLTALWANGLHMRILADHFPRLLEENSGRALLIALVNDIGNGRYTTTGATQAIRGIVAYAGAKQREAASGLTLTARDAKHQPLPMKADGSMLKRLIADHRAAEFVFSGGEGLYWQISSDGFDRILPHGNKGEKIEVRTDYIPAHGGTLADIKQGDEVYVVVSARSTGQRYIDNIAITSLLPGGFEQVISKGGVITGASAGTTSAPDPGYGEDDMPVFTNTASMNEVRSLISKAGLPGRAPMRVTYVDRREDRMVINASLDERETVFIYLIKAVNKGSFTLPVAFAEALYDPDARARTSPGRVEVK